MNNSIGNYHFIHIKAESKCPVCKGRGRIAPLPDSTATTTCPECSGTGDVEINLSIAQLAQLINQQRR